MHNIIKQSAATHYNNGFTLAETLITLVIVGIIAAITVPSLIVKYQKEQTIVGLKTAYSTIQQALNKSFAENGPFESWDNNATNSYDENYYIAEKYIFPYLNVIQNCKVNNKNCFHKRYFLNNNEHGQVDPYARFFLSNGMYFEFATHAYSNFKYLHFRVDINGLKGPNKYGRDMFIFHYNYGAFKNKLVPYGYDGSSRNALLNNCNKNSSGTYCAALIMQDGWNISDDYPW